MAVVARHLIDTSAWARLRRAAVSEVLLPLIEAGLVGTCGIIESEILWSTRSAAGFEAVRADRLLGYEWLPTLDEDWSRAFDVQQELWSGGHIRAVGFPDLLVAAVAERHRLTVWHYDSDFDLIQAVTAQEMRWVVPRGSAP